MYTVFGAGSVGSLLGGFLHLAGIPVRLIAREEHARAIAKRGLVIEGDGERFVAHPPVGGAAEGTVLLTVRAPAVAALAPALRGQVVATFQNGVESEGIAAGYASQVIGAVWRMTSTLMEPGLIRYTRRGRVIVGPWPGGTSPEADRLAADLRAAGFEVALSRDIMADKWLKLAANVVSVCNALVRREDHGTKAFHLLKRRLLEETRDVFRAAGVAARSCDGGDPSLEEMIARAGSAPPRERPVHNSTWRQLSLGRKVDEPFPAAVAALARRAGREAPLSALVARRLEEARAPETWSAQELGEA